MADKEIKSGIFPDVGIIVAHGKIVHIDLHPNSTLILKIWYNYQKLGTEPILACEWLQICAMTLTVIILVEIHN